VWLSTALPCFLSSPHTKPISCEMIESLSEVKARLLREQRERTDERIRELRCERRQNIKRETLGEVRVRAREEQRVRTEERECYTRCQALTPTLTLTLAYAPVSALA